MTIAVSTESSEFDSFRDYLALKTSTYLNKSRKTVLLRVIFSLLIFVVAYWTMIMGIIMIITMTLIVQIKGFFELIDIADQMSKVHNLPWFRSLSWYFLIVANYFFYGENIMEHFQVFIEDMPKMKFLFLYHRFICFLSYMLGFIFFIFTLKKKHGKQQFVLLAWTHVALLVIVMSSYNLLNNSFYGFIWSVHGLGISSCNDVFAYICGTLLGKTPLIKVSPKKTWEGFIGGAIFSIVLSFIMASALCQYDYLVCPIEYKKVNDTIILVNTCERGPIFSLKSYTFDLSFFNISLKTTLTVYPFVLHAFWFALFGSLIAPFGGFFASGFKRAFNVKNFANTIPGHGGILDRFDCQILMTNFINVYIATFVKTASVNKIFQTILKMRPEEQVNFFHIFEEQLLKRGIGLERTNDTLTQLVV